MYTRDDFKNGKIIVRRDVSPTDMAKLISPEWRRAEQSNYYTVRNGTICRYQAIEGINLALPVVNASILLGAIDVIKVNIDFVKAAYAVAPADVKMLLEANVNMFEGTTTRTFVCQMYERFKYCCEWASTIRREFPFVNDKSVNLLHISEASLTSALSLYIQVRASGDYKHKAFYLSPAYEWEIKKEEGKDNYILIPKYK